MSTTTTRKPIDFKSHVDDQQAEDVAFLVAHGSTLEAACRRVGVNLDTLAQRARRAEATTP